MDLVKLKLEEYKIVESFLRKIKREAFAIFVEFKNKDDSFFAYKIAQNGLVIGTFVIINLPTCLLFYFVCENESYDQDLLAEISKIVNEQIKLNRQKETCFNFSMTNKKAISHFEEEDFALDDEGSGYEMSITVENLYLISCSNNLKPENFSKDLIDEYLNLLSASFGEDFHKNKEYYLRFFAKKNKENKFKAYYLDEKLVSIIYMGSDYTVDTLAVANGFQRKRYGKETIFSFLQEYLKTRPELNEIKLHVIETNQRAKIFYEKIGFKCTGAYYETTLKND